MIVGMDGVGTTESGRRVFFVMSQAPFGGMAEKTVVAAQRCVPLPDEVDDVTAAAIANPGLSSVAALKLRAGFKAGETVFVNGATGTAGKLAVQMARFMGAKKVIATGRDAAVLRQVAGFGADVTIDLTGEPKELEEAVAEQFRGDGVDVVLDYLYGERAEMLLTTIAKNYKSPKPLRYVVIGGGSGQEITLPSAVLRAVPVMLMGSGLGSVPFRDLVGAVNDVMQAVVPAKLQIETRVVPLADVEKTWNADVGKARVVFVVR
ncbi:zinc-binding dehydrogenase [Granulicella sp. L60]|uniref:quinone oxidoreductase family protein n=1 Tax=Granulicella sp. L60 TaxID=1641866 RepID=UPI001C202952|nr:zinc-binding dehydrogenase [Granulicella sp. L60]